METISPKTYDTYIKALSDISRAITSDLYIGDILKLVVMVTAKVTGVDICSLWLVDDEKNPKKRKIRLAATQAIDPDYVKDRSLSMDEGVVGYVVTTNRPMQVANVLEEPRFKEKEMAEKLSLVSMLSIPLQTGENEAIGVLNCFTRAPHDFTDTEVNLLTGVANQASVAILNARLMVRTRVIEEELQTRKRIDRAKEILSSRKGINPEAAFRWLQKKSMDTRKTMKEIAEAIILSEDL
ncbi:MAG: GAF and ANTAR domain-containing protein [Thermodesulfobacteriota bacterium]